MDGTQQELTEAITQAIHGEELASTTACDICAQPLDINTPVQYDVMRFSSEAKRRLPFSSHSWIADAARCDDCTIQALGPTTQWLDEALIKVNVTESGGIPLIDCTDIRIIDVSPSNDGYGPPMVDLGMVYRRSDFGLFRWMRVREALRRNPPSSFEWCVLRECVNQSDDVPPSVSRLIS
ncbi:hypothetical protein ACFSBT_09355 [Halomarina rubra]|uniref:Uncharacterized protein n=1 Tax=Halomarina rubra TaxID=2071873 RepID=A0ABD6AV99_9EURY